MRVKLNISDQEAAKIGDNIQRAAQHMKMFKDIGMGDTKNMQLIVAKVKKGAYPFRLQ